jgi:hypothetical protein
MAPDKPRIPVVAGERNLENVNRDRLSSSHSGGRWREDTELRHMLGREYA